MFKDSRITGLTAWSVLEESTTIPVDAFPAYVGSGKCVISQDASGLQGLNHGVQESFGCFPHAGDLYLIVHGMTGNRLSEDNVLPIGYMEWELTVDGERIDSSNLADKGAVWSRELFLGDARTVTGMRLNNHLSLEIGCWVPFGTSSPVFEISLRGFPHMGRTLARPLDVRFRIGLRMSTRQGEPLCEGCTPRGAEIEAVYAGRERYVVRLSADGDNGMERLLLDGWQGLEWNGQVGMDQTVLRTVFSIDEPYRAADIDALRSRHRESWNDYYANAGDIGGLDEKEAFLLHNSLYLLRSGIDFGKGIMIGTPFYFPSCWKASVFWDSHFVMDGLMKFGEREGTGAFLQFLHRNMRPAGKPFPWMFQYDGHATVDEERDIAPVVIAAHAMSAVRFHEYFGDRDVLERYVYPICKRVSDFAIDALFSRAGDGWIIEIPVSNDVVDDVPEEINQTYTIAWFLSILAKTAEYAALLNRGDELRPELEDILAGYRMERNAEEYLHSRGVSADELAGASWIPFLLYPTEATPFVDRELFEKTRARRDFIDLYMKKQGSYQPWTCFMQASSDMRANLPQAAQSSMAQGLRHVFGLGYFSEIGPRQETVGLPPYVTAHGEFLAATAYQFVSDSIWEKELRLFAFVPERYKRRSLQVRGLRCAGGIVVDAEYGGSEIRARFRGNLRGFRLCFPFPWTREDARSSLDVRLDGEAVSYEQGDSAERIRIRIDSEQEQYEIVIR